MEEDIWLPQKIALMPRKINWTEAAVFNHRGQISTWPQIDHFGHQESTSIRVLAPWQGELLNLSYNEGMICNLLATY